MRNIDVVREYFRRVGHATVTDTARDLGFSRGSVSASIKTLLSKGWLVLSVVDVYEYKEPGDHELQGTSETQEKLWRAARISGTFTCWDLAMFSGARLAYARDYVAWLRNKGLILSAGRKGNKPLYRVKAEPPQATPIMKAAKRLTEEELKRETLLDLAGGLLRAIRDNDLARARGLHREIEIGLTVQSVPISSFVEEADQ